jgi:hypothetical protein
VWLQLHSRQHVHMYVPCGHPPCFCLLHCTPADVIHSGKHPGCATPRQLLCHPLTHPTPQHTSTYWRSCCAEVVVRKGGGSPGAALFAETASILKPSLQAYPSPQSGIQVRPLHGTDQGPCPKPQRLSKLLQRRMLLLAQTLPLHTGSTGILPATHMPPFSFQTASSCLQQQ